MHYSSPRTSAACFSGVSAVLGVVVVQGSGSASTAPNACFSGALGAAVVGSEPPLGLPSFVPAAFVYRDHLIAHKSMQANGRLIS